MSRKRTFADAWGDSCGDELPSSSDSHQPATSSPTVATRKAVSTADMADKLVIAPSGDLTLRVTNEGVDDRYILVFSQAMRSASPVWATLLDPSSSFKEGSDENHEITLEDAYDALVILLNIAHLRFQMVPKVLDFQLLLRVAVLLDKYSCVTLVLPWMGRWTHSLKADIKKPGNEEWLFIAWVFGYEEIFTDLSRELVFESNVSESGRLERGRKVFGQTMPPDIIGTTDHHRYTSR